MNTEMDVKIPADRVTLDGTFTQPRESLGLVLFVHGSGSSRMSPRNRFVAQQLNAGGLSTLLFDLLTAEEELVDVQTAEHRFDIEFLANRLNAATEWVLSSGLESSQSLGYFGSSTGAAAALVASTRQRDHVKAIVSRGGRPDLAGLSLPEVRVPTLFIVGGADHAVMDLNVDAMANIGSITKLEVVHGATHLFEEPGTLDQVATLAKEWFIKHLSNRHTLAGVSQSA